MGEVHLISDTDAECTRAHHGRPACQIKDTGFSPVDTGEQLNDFK